MYIGVLQLQIADLPLVSCGGGYTDPLDSFGTMSSVGSQPRQSKAGRVLDLGLVVMGHVRTPKHQLSRLSMI